MKIDLLYFDGCPSWENALENLHAVVEGEGVDIQIRRIEVKTDQDAEDRKFLGSPSFQIDGKDLWPESRENYSMSCRIYRTPQGLKGWPTIEMLRYKVLNYAKGKDFEK